MVFNETPYERKTMSVSLRSEFRNERDEYISMTVTYDKNGVTLQITSANQNLIETLTPIEAKQLHLLMDPKFTEPAYVKDHIVKP